MQTLYDKNRFIELLKHHNLSVTNARLMIFTVLQEADRPLTIKELTKVLPSVHYVSVYRTIDTLVKVGAVKPVTIGFKTSYELGDAFKPHHHHVTCERCSISVPIHNNAIEQLMKQVTLQAGLRPTKHHFELYGICNECQQSPSADS